MNRECQAKIEKWINENESFKVLNFRQKAAHTPKINPTVPCWVDQLCVRFLCAQLVMLACQVPHPVNPPPRDVTCVHEVTQGSGNAVTVPNNMCPQPAPPDRQYCNVLDCPVRWTTSDWSKCSRTCGGGEKVRRVECKQVIRWFLKKFGSRDVKFCRRVLQCLTRCQQFTLSSCRKCRGMFNKQLLPHFSKHGPTPRSTHPRKINIC